MSRVANVNALKLSHRQVGCSSEDDGTASTTLLLLAASIILVRMLVLLHVMMRLVVRKTVGDNAIDIGGSRRDTIMFKDGSMTLGRAAYIAAV